MPYKIEIQLSDEQFAALESHRKQAKQRIADPADPEAVVEKPTHKNVSAMIRAAVMQAYAPVIHSNRPPEVEALIEEIKRKQKQANDILDEAVVVTVTRK